MSTARFWIAGTGTAISGLNFGGETPPGSLQTATEEWVGAGSPVGAWSTAADMNNSLGNRGSIGVYNAALAVGGRPPSTAINEQWNGSSWTEVGDINTARHSMSTSGTTTSAIISGGENGGYRGVVEEWNGSAWTETTDINTARGEGAGAGGSAEGALIYAGIYSPPTSYKTITELWNGSSWTEVADLSQARYQCTPGIGKSTTSALCVGGLLNPGNQLFANNEAWNGSTWTEVNDLNVAKRATAGQSGTGVSALCFGGLTATPAYVRTNEDWNGSSWVELADMSASGGSGGGGAAADSTAAVPFGGYVGSYSASTEEWSSSSNSTKTISTD